MVSGNDLSSGLKSTIVSQIRNMYEIMSGHDDVKLFLDWREFGIKYKLRKRTVQDCVYFCELLFTYIYLTISTSNT